VPCRTFPQVDPVSVKEKILMLVVLGSRLAISCVLNHQSSSGSSGITNFLFRCSRLSVNETDVVGAVIIKFREPEHEALSRKNKFGKAIDFNPELSYLDKRLMNVS